MTWFKVDDNLHNHPKAIGAGNAAIGLWTRAGSWCSDHLTDGFVPRAAARSMGTASEIRALVRERLWVEVDGGYRFHEWGQRQPSKAEVEAERAKTAQRVAAWRNRNRNSESNGVTDGVSSTVGTASPSPSPSLSTSLVSLSPTVTRASQDDRPDLDLDKIATQLGSDHAWAKRVAADVLSRANGTRIRQPTQYVLGAITVEPERYRQTHGPPNVHDLCRHGLPAGRCDECATVTTEGATP